MNRKLLEFMPCHSRLWRQMDLHPCSTGFPRSRKKIQVSPWDRSVFPSFKGRGCCRVRPKKECSCRLEQKINRNDYVTNSWLFNRPFLKIQEALRFSVIKRYHSFGCRCWVLVFGQHIEEMVETYWLLYGSFWGSKSREIACEINAHSCKQTTADWCMKTCFHFGTSREIWSKPCKFRWEGISFEAISWSTNLASFFRLQWHALLPHSIANLTNHSSWSFPWYISCTFISIMYLWIYEYRILST